MGRVNMKGHGWGFYPYEERRITKPFFTKDVRMIMNRDGFYADGSHCIVKPNFKKTVAEKVPYGVSDSKSYFSQVVNVLQTKLDEFESSKDLFKTFASINGEFNVFVCTCEFHDFPFVIMFTSDKRDQFFAYNANFLDNILTFSSCKENDVVSLQHHENLMVVSNNSEIFGLIAPIGVEEDGRKKILEKFNFFIDQQAYSYAA